MIHTYIYIHTCTHICCYHSVLVQDLYYLMLKPPQKTRDDSATQQSRITTYQPVLFVANSLEVPLICFGVAHMAYVHLMLFIVYAYVLR